MRRQWMQNIGLVTAVNGHRTGQLSYARDRPFFAVASARNFGTMDREMR
jgi:hypothetical protein